MIYLDNAATSFPKPPEVVKAVELCLTKFGANPGRAGHRLALQTGKIVEESRKIIASLFNIKTPERIIFTYNATEALNLAIKGLLKPGDHVITSSFEHNSVTRPLEYLKKSGVQVTKLETDPVFGIDLAKVEKAIQPNTRLIAITHASNVTGTVLPIAIIGEIAKKHHIPFLVDASQTAGILPIDVESMNISLLAFPGHKGLMGPQGIGCLYISEQIELIPLKQGGTGSISESLEQPDFLPDKYESGTPNTPGIAGMAAGIQFIKKTGIQTIKEHEDILTERLLEKILQIQDIHVYGPLNTKNRVAVVSLNIKNIPSPDIADRLSQDFDICVRAGHHCAPDTHNILGTLGQGTVRISLGYFNTSHDIDRIVEALAFIAKTA